MQDSDLGFNMCLTYGLKQGKHLHPNDLRNEK